MKNKRKRKRYLSSSNTFPSIHVCDVMICYLSMPIINDRIKSKEGSLFLEKES
ncbi:hypothetical protein X975_19054, partial [Stegodyphus mimosarum]